MTLLRWNIGGGNHREGTLAQYIAEHYPYYQQKGLSSWETILKYLKGKQKCPAA